MKPPKTLTEWKAGAGGLVLPSEDIVQMATGGDPESARVLLAALAEDLRDGAFQLLGEAQREFIASCLDQVIAGEDFEKAVGLSRPGRPHRGEGDTFDELEHVVKPVLRSELSGMTRQKAIETVAGKGDESAVRKKVRRNHGFTEEIEGMLAAAVEAEVLCGTTVDEASAAVADTLAGYLEIAPEALSRFRRKVRRARDRHRGSRFVRWITTRPEERRRKVGHALARAAARNLKPLPEQEHDDSLPPPPTIF